MRVWNTSRFELWYVSSFKIFTFLIVLSTSVIGNECEKHPLRCKNCVGFNFYVLLTVNCAKSAGDHAIWINWVLGGMSMHKVAFETEESLLFSMQYSQIMAGAQ